MRPSKDEYFMQVAKLVATRSTCKRRSVGCVLVSNKSYILSTGYNGPPSGFPHCIDVECPGATYAGTGLGLDFCEAIHAEQNAIIQAGLSGNLKEAFICYCTTSPCITCVKLLINTPVEIIVSLERYPHKEAEQLWKRAQRKWNVL